MSKRSQHIIVVAWEDDVAVLKLNLKMDKHSWKMWRDLTEKAAERHKCVRKTARYGDYSFKITFRGTSSMDERAAVFRQLEAVYGSFSSVKIDFQWSLPRGLSRISFTARRPSDADLIDSIQGYHLDRSSKVDRVWHMSDTVRELINAGLNSL